MLFVLVYPETLIHQYSAKRLTTKKSIFLDMFSICLSFRSRPKVAHKVLGLCVRAGFGVQSFNLLLKFNKSTKLQVYTSARLTQNRLLAVVASCHHKFPDSQFFQLLFGFCVGFHFVVSRVTETFASNLYVSCWLGRFVFSYALIK